jgi:DegV family protein with EDD domain
MGSTCIITDDSAQFTNPGFQKNPGLKFLSHKLVFSANPAIARAPIKVADFPKQVSPDFTPQIISPSIEEISICLEKNLSAYDDIFIILLSSEISPLFERAEKLCASLHGHANFHLIDSLNTSLGLGLIVQYASELIDQGLPPVDVEKSLRLIIPHVYTLLSTPNLSYLQATGLLDVGQATVGEMLSLSPLFLIEDGVLNPLQKVKNQHGAMEYFIEFIDEFDSLRHVALIQPAHSSIAESRFLRQHVDENYPTAAYSEYPLNPFLASMIGPRGFGIVVMEQL